MRNQFKVRRYGNKTDTSQVSLWKDWKNIYDGWFVKQRYDVETVFKNAHEFVIALDYEDVDV